MNVSIRHSEKRQRRGIPGFLASLGMTAVLLLPLAVYSETKVPTKHDFAYGFYVRGMSQQSMLEMPLPDGVYAVALNADLSDLRVFGSDGGVLPHEICHTPAVEPPTPKLIELPVFPLKAGESAEAGLGARIELKTASGTTVNVTEGGAPETATELNAYIVDLREIEQPLLALRFNWSSADAASETTLRIKGSEDLQGWYTLMDSATLLRTRSGDAELQRARIPLPENRPAFLRFEAAGSMPLPQLDRVVAEVQGESEAPNPNWFDAQSVPADKTEHDTAFWFDAARVAPLYTAGVRLPDTNMALVVQLQSRPDHKLPWRKRWQGEVFALSTLGAEYANVHSVVHFAPTTDRYWRVEVLRGAETLHGNQPALRLGYQPALLRFLRQDEGPFLVAYGSARVEKRAPPGCGELLGKLGKDERREMTGKAEASGKAVWRNLSALKPLPKPTPLRQIVLWGVLILGALLVAGMALSLLKKLRQE